MTRMTDATFRPPPPPWPVRRRPPSKRRKQDCVDCGIDTSFGTGNAHYHRVHDVIWRAAVPDGLGQLCLDCLAQRLGRPLTRADFDLTPSEVLDRMSARYIDGERVSPERFAAWLDEQEADSVKAGGRGPTHG
jgi:hypothetical protein